MAIELYVDDTVGNGFFALVKDQDKVNKNLTVINRFYVHEELSISQYLDVNNAMYGESPLVIFDIFQYIGFVQLESTGNRIMAMFDYTMGYSDSIKGILLKIGMTEEARDAFSESLSKICDRNVVLSDRVIFV